MTRKEYAGQLLDFARDTSAFCLLPASEDIAPARLSILHDQKALQAQLRRGVSAAYYALFYALIDRVCHELLDKEALDAGGLTYEMAARAFEHGSMRESCNQFISANSKTHIKYNALDDSLTIPNPGIQLIAQRFIELQILRHKADYDVDEPVTIFDAEDAYNKAFEAITRLELYGDDQTDAPALFRTFLSSLLFNKITYLFKENR